MNTKMVVVVVVSWFFLLSLFKKGHFIFFFRFYPAVSYTTRVLCIFLNLIPNNMLTFCEEESNNNR